MHTRIGVRQHPRRLEPYENRLIRVLLCPDGYRNYGDYLMTSRWGTSRRDVVLALGGQAARTAEAAGHPSGWNYERLLFVETPAEP
ncbi:hypothetical protein ACIHBQ_21295 [Streptomyces sp. NPDC052492]|uniref:hypothetical protein n=1 Tax=unclassified Streptomyces TaxID=2593676 RepID=UPI0037D3929F